LTERNTSLDEARYVYFKSTNTWLDHDFWLIGSSASWHMTPHREWFSRYEKYERGDVLLGDDLTTNIVG